MSEPEGTVNPDLFMNVDATRTIGVKAGPYPVSLRLGFFVERDGIEVRAYHKGTDIYLVQEISEEPTERLSQVRAAIDFFERSFDQMRQALILEGGTTLTAKLTNATPSFTGRVKLEEEAT